MSSPSTFVPLSVAAKTRADLSQALLQIQIQQGGKVSIITIYYDDLKREHVCWYYPLRSLGSMS